MSKILSLKIQEDVFKETEEILKKIDIPRNRYINRAIAYYNRLNKRRSLAKALREESMQISKDSMDALLEFEKFEEDLP